MSYTRIKSDDGVSDFFSNISNFMNILPNMLQASDPDVFFVWFEKLDEIDRRSLYRYILTHNIRVPKAYKSYILDKYAHFRDIDRLRSQLTDAGGDQT